jgi:hypothetical protein
MALNRVWTGYDAFVYVYWNDADGNRINKNGGPWTETDGPLVPYCFFQNMTLDGNVPNVRRPVTGRPQKRLLVDIDEWELSVEHFYVSKVKELDPTTIFARDKILELVLKLQAPENLTDEDDHTLVPARRIACTVTGRENEVLVGTAKFAAEQFK